MFIEFLLIIAKTWKQLRCPSVGEQIQNLWYIQTMDNNSAPKISKLSSCEKKWINFKCILLRKRSQSETAVYCVSPSIWHAGKVKPMETVKISVVTRGKWREINRWGRIFSVWNYFIRYVMVNTCHYTFTQTYSMRTSRANSNMNCGLGVVMCQCRFTSCNKYTSQVRNVDIRGGYACVWGYEDSVLSAQF